MPTRPSGASFLQRAHATPDPRGWVVEYAPSASREPTLQTAGMKTVQAARHIQTHQQAAAWSQPVPATLDRQAQTENCVPSASRARTRLVVGMPTARAARQIPTHLWAAAWSHSARATLDSRMELSWELARRASSAHSKLRRGAQRAIAALQIRTRLRRVFPRQRACATLATLDPQEALAQRANPAHSRPTVTILVCHVRWGKPPSQARHRQQSALFSALPVPLGQTAVRARCVWQGSLRQALGLMHARPVLLIQIQ